MTQTSHSSQKIPKLRFREFQGEWEVSTLKNLCKIPFSNGVFNDPRKVGRGFKLINVKDMYVGETIRANNLTLIDIEKNEFLRNKVENGDIFFTRSSLVKEGIAYPNVYIGDNQEITFDGHIIRMRPDDTIATPQFLCYHFRTPSTRKKFIQKGKTTAMTTIGQEDIGSISINYPDLLEQQKIASFLSSVDTRIEQLREKKSRLEEYKNGVMKKIFAREIRFKDENGKEYGEWEEKRFDDIFISIGTKSFQVKSSDILQNGEFPIIDQGQDMIAGYSNDSSKLLKNTPVIVFGDHTTILKYIDFNFIVGADGTKVLRNLQGNLKYLFYFLDFNRPNQEGYKRHFSVLRELSVSFPTLPEQQKIASFLSEIDARIQSTTEQLEEAEKWKKGLLQAMFV